MQSQPLHDPLQTESASEHPCALPLTDIASTNQPLTWLWHQRIPRGKLTLLDAEPGSGTSLLALTIAASVSSGRPLPGDPATSATPGNVLLLAPHDDAGDTIQPRLQAAGGDPNHVFLLTTVPTEAATSSTPMTERPFCLAENLALLEATIKRLCAVLVIIDPLHTALLPGRVRSSSRPAPHPRAILLSLAELAQRTGCAFLLTRSVKLRPSELRHPRPTGSPDLVSAARSGLLIACDHDDEQTHLLLSTKSSLCQQPAALAYQVIEHAPGVPALHWLEDGEDVLASVLEHGPSRSAQREGILDYLSNWFMPAGAQEVANFLDCGYERVRKMMQRMLEAGELVSPFRGLYTTPDHYCLQYSAADLAKLCHVDSSTASDDDSTQNHVPNVANTPDQATGPNPAPSIAHRESEPIQVPNVATDAPLLNEAAPAGGTPALSSAPLPKTTRSNPLTFTSATQPGALLHDPSPSDPPEDRYPSAIIRPKPDDYDLPG